MGKSITAFNKGISSALESLKERGDVSPLVAEELQTTVESIKTKIERQKKYVNFQRFPTLDAKKLVNAPKMSAHHRGICHF